MPDVTFQELIEARLGIVSVGLYEGVTTGFAAARQSWDRLDEPNNRWLLAMTARARMRDFWERNPLGQGWTVEGNAALMGQTALVSPDRKLTLRLLKENRRLTPGGVPAAGRNRRRRDAFAQAPLPGMALAGDPDTAAATAHCLLLWDATWEDGEPALQARVVHTVGPGSYGRQVPIDLSYSIQPAGDVFYQRQFVGDQQLESLFPNISKQENEQDVSSQ